MVEPTIWPAWEGEKAEQGEECKTRQTYGRTNHLARLGRERRQKQGEECKTRRTYGRTNHLARLGGQRRRKQGEDCKTRRTNGRTNHLARLGGDKAETGRRVKFHDPRRMRS
ncbi:hypothetical protein DPMN_004670 [Dreissena polymorpha]|uniref:Uncharacterized protein n=1 Tax=Dreissena polymorpha TaxID=45954 RepID=A0A9D4MQM6_DREPO|nr:hypothetical protein DPMN_004670 [Dreissena polymorpha]